MSFICMRMKNHFHRQWLCTSSRLTEALSNSEMAYYYYTVRNLSSFLYTLFYILYSVFYRWKEVKEALCHDAHTECNARTR